MSNDVFGTLKSLDTPQGKVQYHSLKSLQSQGHAISKLPFSIRVLLENALRNCDGLRVTKENVETILGWTPAKSDKDIPFTPARVLLQDFTGVPCVVDLASLRAEAGRKGKDVSKINPLVPVDLVIDHSVQVEYYGTNSALQRNVALEYERNGERYQLLKWAQKAFDNFTAVPPGMGICHQVNLEFLSKGVLVRDGMAFPDSCFGTDSHTPMVNGIGVVAWGVGGIEAEAAMLGQPSYFIMPEVVGLKLTGQLPAGATATDMVLAITELLRKHGVVGKFVEVYGDGLNNLSVPDRATISNMSPEFGCTITYFPIDDQTLEYMRRTARPEDHVQMVETYCKENMLWRESEDEIQYSTSLELDLGTLEPAVAGPKRPQDRILVRNLDRQVRHILKESFSRSYVEAGDRQNAAAEEGMLRSTEVTQGEALSAGYSPEETPTKTQTNTATIIQFQGTIKVPPRKMAMRLPRVMPRKMPKRPPSWQINIASIRNCVAMEFEVAPIDLRTPISRVRSVTETSIILSSPTKAPSRIMVAMPNAPVLRMPPISSSCFNKPVLCSKAKELSLVPLSLRTFRNKPSASPEAMDMSPGSVILTVMV